jgi:hypothetical protein
MDTTATTMVVLTSPEEQAERETWIRRFAQRYAGVLGDGVAPPNGHDAVRERFEAPAASPELRQMARDFRLALAILGVDVSPPPPPGTCSGCGRARTLADSASGTPRCQQCMRRLQAGGRT